MSWNKVKPRGRKDAILMGKLNRYKLPFRQWPAFIAKQALEGIDRKSMWSLFIYLMGNDRWLDIDYIIMEILDHHYKRFDDKKPNFTFWSLWNYFEWLKENNHTFFEKFKYWNEAEKKYKIYGD